MEKTPCLSEIPCEHWQHQAPQTKQCSARPSSATAPRGQAQRAAPPEKLAKRAASPEKPAKQVASPPEKTAKRAASPEKAAKRAASQEKAAPAVPAAPASTASPATSSRQVDATSEDPFFFHTRCQSVNGPDKEETTKTKGDRRTLDV